MSIRYHCSKSYVVFNGLSKLSVGCTAHFKEDTKDLAVDVRRLA